VAYWKIKYKGKQEYEPWYLLTNLSSLKSAINQYLRSTLGNRSDV